MYTLLRSVTVRNLLATQAPAFLISFVIAQFVYTGMHNFAAELFAFLATWFVLDAALTHIARWLQRGASPDEPPLR